MDFSPFAVGGAATRSDSFTKLRPEFASGVYRMVQDARAAGVPLEITSAYRSPDLQAQLFDDAVAKYGSPEAARKFVAPAGRSQHNFGTAVDFAVNGQLIRDPQSAEAKWIRENAAKYGLAVPMDWEPWQVELKGARAQTLGKGGSMLKPIGATPQMDKKEDKTDFRDIAGNLAIAFNSLRHRPDPNVTAAVQNIQQQRTAKAAKNKTMEFLKRSGRDDLVGLFNSGVIDGKGAASILLQDAESMRKKGELAATAEVLAKQFEAAGNSEAAAFIIANPSAQNVNNASQVLFSNVFGTGKDSTVMSGKDIMAANPVITGLNPNSAYTVKTKGGAIIDIDAIGSDAPQVDPMRESYLKTKAAQFEKDIEIGNQARRNSAQLRYLGDLLSQSGTGFEAGLRSQAAALGFDTRGDTAAAAEAIINQLVPQQRPPGSGVISDKDLELYKASLPQISARPEGNRLIVESAVALAEYDIQVAEISEMALEGKITPEQATAQIAELPNPFANISSMLNMPSASGPPPTGGEPDMSGAQAIEVLRKEGILP